MSNLICETGATRCTDVPVVGGRLSGTCNPNRTGDGEFGSGSLWAKAEKAIAVVTIAKITDRVISLDTLRIIYPSPPPGASSYF